MGSPSQTHRDLKVWQRGCDLAVEVYRLTASFPRSEDYGMTSQMRRAAYSIPANIAEGQARRTDRELLQFLHIAAGSLAELETFFELASRVGHADSDSVVQARALTDEVGKMLYGLISHARGRAR